MKKILTVIMLCCAVAAFADERKTMPRFDIPTAKSNSMGGHHVAYTDNVFSLLVNPAAMMRVEQRSFLALSPTLLSPQNTFGLLSPLLDAADGNMGSLGEATDILSKEKGKIGLGVDIKEFPLSIAWVADGLGFGLWDRIFVNPNIIGTNIDVNVYGDVIMPVGFAFRILHTDSHDIDAGVTVKGFARALLQEKINIMSLTDDDFDLKDALSAPLILGFGFDAGLLYRWDIGISAGITFSDIFTFGSVITDFIGDNNKDTYTVPFSLNWGVAYDFKLNQLWKTAPNLLGKTGFSIAFDWRDFFNVFQQDDYLKRNSALNIGVGFQFSLFDILKIRAGMNECLPAFGIGVDGGPIEFGVAYYGKELGNEPGQLSVAALDLTFAIRPGAKKREWPWTQRSIIGLFTGGQ